MNSELTKHHTETSMDSELTKHPVGTSMDSELTNTLWEHQWILN